MMNLYTETYEIVLIEQSGDHTQVTDSIGPVCKSVTEARAFIERAPTLIDSCKYVIRKTVVSYLI